MSSCAEATYFIRHCPGTQMDGDHDGIPCESQWCS
ncbi:MAG: excalibur calcium-binding domain-containing protein [Xanthomonadales bacterium]|nr:excalibur calcium-binding domain-containing protein [Xanthomonadales bacterium]